MISLDKALSQLDEHQRAAVAAVRDPSSGHLRLQAAAGSGKTRVLVTALAALVLEDRIDPSLIMATTFTRKAGDELISRLGALVPVDPLRAMTVGTFHSIALRRLRTIPGGRPWGMSYCIDVGGTDVPSSQAIWESIVGWRRMGVHGTNEKSLDCGKDMGKAYALQADLLRSQGLHPSTAEGRDEARRSDLTKFVDAWKLYEDAKLALGAWDFSDALVAYLVALQDGLLADRPAFLFVDEAQDNSRVQLEIAKLLSKSGKLVLVGDGRQSIYAFRGATPALFQASDVEFGTKTLDIPTNYRSVAAIVEVGNRVGDRLGARFGLHIEPAVAGRSTPGTVEYHAGSVPLEESRCAAQIIQARLKAGAKPDDFAILVRTNAAAGLFEGALMMYQIPCVRVGGKPFFERVDVLAMIAYLLLGTHDSFEAFTRILNKPQRYLPKTFTHTVGDEMNAGKELLPAIHSATFTLKGVARSRAEGFYRTLKKHRALRYSELIDQAHKLVLESLPPPAADGIDEDRQAALDIVADLAQRFPDAASFAQYASACSANSTFAMEQARKDTAGRVTISTVHRSKGLQWPTVIVSAPDGVFPSSRALLTADGLQEELRLAYVAFTRAQDHLHILWSGRNQDMPPPPYSFLSAVAAGIPVEDPEPPQTPRKK